MSKPRTTLDFGSAIPLFWRKLSLPKFFVINFKALYLLGVSKWPRARIGRATFDCLSFLARSPSTPASSLSEKVSFNRINRKTGNRLKQQNVDTETGEMVSREDVTRGYEVGKSQYLIVEDEELNAVQLESTRTIDIDQFVPRNEIDDRYIDLPYYMAPDGQVGQDAFAVIRDTIGKLNMVAIGRVVLTRREHVIALEPRGRGLLELILRYPYEIRDENAYFEDIPELKLPKEMLDLATHIVNTKSGHFDPSQFEDRYEKPSLTCLRRKRLAKRSSLSRRDRRRVWSI